MTKTRFLALVTALALLLAIPTSVFAQNAKPHVFVGTATLDGATAADGPAVTAWVGCEQVAATTVTGREYDILVGDSVGYAGETVSFKLSGADASETATWVEGGGDIVNLTAATGSSGSSGTGDDGEKGDTGNRGLTGVAGPAGPAGADGAAAPAGPAGATGSNGSDGSDGAAVSSGSSGSAGPAGPAGAAGAAGADGGGGVVGIIALIVAAVALLAAGGSYMMGRRA